MVVPEAGYHAACLFYHRTWEVGEYACLTEDKEKGRQLAIIYHAAACRIIGLYIYVYPYGRDRNGLSRL